MSKSGIQASDGRTLPPKKPFLTVTLATIFKRQSPLLARAKDSRVDVLTNHEERPHQHTMTATHFSFALPSHATIPSHLLPDAVPSMSKQCFRLSRRRIRFIPWLPNSNV
jgi:hypothetical protein